MNLVEEKPRGLIPIGLKRWPLKLYQAFRDTNSVLQSPAGPAGCAGVDPGFLERGFVCIKVWGIRFADFISFFLNIL